MSRRCESLVGFSVAGSMVSGLSPLAGLSLVRLSAPVFVIGAALAGLSLWLNTRVVPHSKASTRQLIYDQAVRDPGSRREAGYHAGYTTCRGSEFGPASRLCRRVRPHGSGGLGRNL